MKASEQYFPVVLFIMLRKVVLTSESVDKILRCHHSNESYWAVLSCGTVYYAVVLTFKSVDETPKCDHSNDSFWAVLSCGTVYCGVQGDCNLKSVTIQMKAERYFLWYSVLCYANSLLFQ